MAAQVDYEKLAIKNNEYEKEYYKKQFEECEYFKSNIKLYVITRDTINKDYKKAIGEIIKYINDKIELYNKYNLKSNIIIYSHIPTHEFKGIIRTNNNLILKSDNPLIITSENAEIYEYFKVIEETD